jgi:F0F1-type ATP synthase membrane subunit b/b'
METKKRIEEKIKKIEKNLEKIGPVSKTIIKDAARELNFLKGEKIEIENEEDFEKFIKKLEEKLSKIVGKVSKTLIQVD